MGWTGDCGGGDMEMGETTDCIGVETDVSVADMPIGGLATLARGS